MVFFGEFKFHRRGHVVYWSNNTHLINDEPANLTPKSCNIKTRTIFHLAMPTGSRPAWEQQIFELNFGER